jgi:hypothetical protein
LKISDDYPEVSTKGWKCKKWPAGTSPLTVQTVAAFIDP